MEGAKAATGGDPTSIGLLSFTRAARQEAAERAAKAWSVPPEMLTQEGWIRTGHSICYRQLGVESKQMISESKADQTWVANQFGVNLSTSVDSDSCNQVWIGDARVSWSLNAWQYHRVTLLPLDEVVRRMSDDPDAQDISEVQLVADHYETAKRANDRYDFTDILMRFAGVSCSPRHGVSRVTPEGELPPVKTWLFDEQQDASPLLDLVCRRLIEGPKVKYAYAVGDPFQSIYGFAGSSSACFLGWKVVKERTMPKSYRCPAEILELGEKCLRRMTAAGKYWDRGVEPSGGDGEISEWSDLEDLTNVIDGKDDWLFLARTNFQASRIMGYLSSIGVPYRTTKSSGVPSTKQIGMSALYKLERDEPIGGDEWIRAISLLPSRSREGEMIKRGTKKKWNETDESLKWDFILREDIEKIGGTTLLCDAIKKGEWCKLVDHGTAWRESAIKYGTELTSSPRVRVGTIHSSKGMEAENVAVLTTTSKRVQQSESFEEQANEECRLAYVAVTRSSRNLHIINEGGFRTPRMEALA
jgi:superfamily I DNA/RNA helicase